MITLTLPWPPTVNTYWRHVLIKGQPRTLISKRGREYRKLVFGHVMAQKAARRLTGRLKVAVDAYVPDRRPRDIDNLFKAIGDALTRAGVWVDDSQIDRLDITRCERVAGGKIVMVIEEVSANG